MLALMSVLEYITHAYNASFHRKWLMHERSGCSSRKIMEFAATADEEIAYANSPHFDAWCSVCPFVQERVLYECETRQSSKTIACNCRIKSVEKQV